MFRVKRYCTLVIKSHSFDCIYSYAHVHLLLLRERRKHLKPVHFYINPFKWTKILVLYGLEVWGLRSEVCSQLVKKPYFLLSKDQLITAWHFASHKSKFQEKREKKPFPNPYPDVIICIILFCSFHLISYYVISIIEL